MRAVLIVILLGAAMVRLTGIDFGLPFLYDSDESAFVNRALSILNHRTLNPGWFGHPGTFTIYSLAAVFVVYAGGSLLTGRVPSLAAIELAARTDPSIFHLIGRLMVAAFGVLTVLATYRLALRVADNRAALISAALVAVAPLAVSLSVGIRPDMQMTFLLTWVMYFSVRIAEDGRWRDYLIAGALLGLSVTAKYPSVVAAVPITVAHCVHRSWSGRPATSNVVRLVGAGAASVAWAFLGSPYLFLDFATVLRNVAYEARPEHLGSTSPGFVSSIYWYICSVLAANVTAAGLALACLGALAILKHRNRRAGWVLASFFVAFLIFISALRLRWDRWALPLVPVVTIFCGVGTSLVSDQLARWMPTRRVVVTSATAMIIAWILSPLRTTLTNVRERAGGDTRTEAHAWILKNIPAGSSILLERYCPQLPNGRYKLFEVANDGIQPVASEMKYVPTTGVLGELRDDVRSILDSPATYIVIGDYDRRIADSAGERATLVPYQFLFDEFELVYEIDRQPGKRLGFGVRIFRKPEPVPGYAR